MVAQAGEPDYALNTLGWKAFQDLCVTISAELFGQTFQAFNPSKDGGRDGAFYGTVKVAGDYVPGSITLQCKFSTSDRVFEEGDFRSEIPKATRLASKGLAANYVLMTNLSVTAPTEGLVRESLMSIDGIERVSIFGKESITRVLRESSRLRMLVPRVYGLGDLSLILDERALDQAAAILSGWRDDLKKLVVTKAYGHAARALDQHGFVLLLGEPAAGKSTIGASLAISALDNWNCPTFKIHRSSEFIEHWHPHDPKRFFWIDDAFGATQYQGDLGRDWNAVWPYMSTAINQGSKVVLTSRSYIYQAARRDLKASAFPLLNESQVVVKVEDLSPSERSQILYNHLKFGDQPRAFRTAIKPHLTTIANDPSFLPEVARRLGNSLFTKHLSLTSAGITQFVQSPVEFLIDVVGNLDNASRAALSLIFMRAGALESPVTLTPDEERAVAMLGATPAEAIAALSTLSGSLTLLSQAKDTANWIFKHPTIGDAYASIVSKEPDLIDLYLNWTKPEVLIKEVTCGDVEIEGAKVRVPSNRFPLMLDRLQAVPDRKLITFLAERCSPGFLATFMTSCPELGPTICRVRSYLSASSNVALLAKLHGLGLLPSEWRDSFVGQVQALAIETPDLDVFSHPRIRCLLTDDELRDLRALIRDHLVPNLQQTIDDWADVHDRDIDPEDWYSPLTNVLDILQAEFAGDQLVQDAVADASVAIDEEVARIYSNADPDDDRDAYDFEEAGSPQPSVETGSIFDDVDA